jgi:hypothetical protein
MRVKHISTLVLWLLVEQPLDVLTEPLERASYEQKNERDH